MHLADLQARVRIALTNTIANEWTLFTPEASAHWGGRELRFGPGSGTDNAPPPDALDFMLIIIRRKV